MRKEKLLNNFRKCKEIYRKLKPVNMKQNNLLLVESEKYLYFNLYEPYTTILMCPFSNRMWKESEVIFVYNHL